MTGAAIDRLAYGDRLNDRIASGEDSAALAIADGLSPQAVSKAAWLARSYTDDARRAIGVEALSALRPSHLEVVATVPDDVRTRLLREAAGGHLSVRELRLRVAEFSLSEQTDPPRDEVKVVGTPKQLSSASTAISGYSRFDDNALRMLLAGPNGIVIRDLALAGRNLAARIEEVTPLSHH